MPLEGPSFHATRLKIYDEIVRLRADIDRLLTLLASETELTEMHDAFGDHQPAEALLTSRQHEILALVSEGKGTKQIARELWLAPATVRNHVSAILSALEAHSRLEAVAKARQRGLLDDRRPRAQPVAAQRRRATEAA